MKLHLIHLPYYFPDEGTGDDYAQDMNVLNDEGEEDPNDKPDPDVTELKDEEPPDDDPDDDDEDDEKIVAEKESEEEEEEPEEKEEPELSPTGRPSIKSIKKEFPEVFKKFPVLKTSLFRDEEFSKHFATPEEAGEAAVKSANYDQIEASLVEGSPELILTELHQNNPRAFEKVVENWLPKLRQLDEKSYITATEPVIEELIYLAFKHAERTGDKNLGMSARHIANFVFANGGEIPDVAKKKGQAPNPAEETLKREREQWAQTRFKEADAEIFEKVTGTLDKTIRQGLDLSGTMTERMKASIVKDVIAEANTLLGKNDAHKRRMAGLWRRAHQDSYSMQSKESIVNTYLSGVKPLLRDIRNRIRTEYLGGQKRQLPSNGNERIAIQPQKKRSFEGSSKRVDVRRERAAVLDPKKIDYSRTSDADILSGKVTLRGQKR